MHRSNPSIDFSVTVSQLGEFDEWIDVRSPSEFAADHIIGSINLPVLSDAERALVGTEFKQVSPFTAKRIGAAYVARNIAGHLEQELSAKPKSWRPLVYCWRGGTRSGAMVEVFRKIGWQASQLAGGYKAYRHHVNESLAAQPPLFRFVVIAGPTGCGKSPLLQILARRGLQVLDLEALACHRGSVLGDLPEAPQPTQKFFESLVWHQLTQFNPDDPIYIEAESQKIGRLRVPPELLSSLRAGKCIKLRVPLKARVDYLKNEYAHFLTDPDLLSVKLAHLSRLHSADTINRWQGYVKTQSWEALVEELLSLHYDPGYEKSTQKNFTGYDLGLTLNLEGLSPIPLQHAAEKIAAFMLNPSDQ